MAILGNLGIAYTRKDDFQKSIKYFNKALQIEYNSETLSHKGICLARFGRLEKAISIGVGAALQMEPDNLFTLKMKAGFLSKHGEHSKTLAVCDQILQLTNNQDEEILQLKAKELNNNGKYKEAIHIYNKFLELNPDHVSVLYQKAHILAILNKKDEAVTIHNNILQKHPHNIQILTAKGAILYQEHLYERAITTCYDVILNMYSADATAWAGKGYCLAMQGKYNQGIECFENAISSKPDNLTALTGKASCLLEIGRYEESIEVLKKILKIENDTDFQPDLKNIFNFEPDHYTSLYLLSLAYAKLEDYPKAQEYWDKYCKVLSMKQQIDDTNPENKITVAMSWF